MNLSGKEQEAIDRAMNSLKSKKNVPKSSWKSYDEAEIDKAIDLLDIYSDGVHKEMASFSKYLRTNHSTDIHNATYDLLNEYKLFGDSKSTPGEIDERILSGYTIFAGRNSRKQSKELPKEMSAVGGDVNDFITKNFDDLTGQYSSSEEPSLGSSGPGNDLPVFIAPGQNSELHQQCSLLEGFDKNNTLKLIKPSLYDNRCYQIYQDGNDFHWVIYKGRIERHNRNKSKSVIKENPSPDKLHALCGQQCGPAWHYNTRHYVDPLRKEQGEEVYASFNKWREFCRTSENFHYGVGIDVANPQAAEIVRLEEAFDAYIQGFEGTKNKINEIRNIKRAYDFFNLRHPNISVPYYNADTGKQHELYRAVNRELGNDFRQNFDHGICRIREQDGQWYALLSAEAHDGQPEMQLLGLDEQEKEIAEQRRLFPDFTKKISAEMELSLQSELSASREEPQVKDKFVDPTTASEAGLGSRLPSSDALKSPEPFPIVNAVPDKPSPQSMENQSSEISTTSLQASVASSKSFFKKRKTSATTEERECSEEGFGVKNAFKKFSNMLQKPRGSR